MRVFLVWVVVFTLVSFFTKTAQAGFIEWHSSNIQILRGWEYELGKGDRTILSFEHANRWAYGDFFMFSDLTRFDGGGTNIIAEFSPRFSLSKITDKDWSYGLIKDVLISTTLEKGKNTSRAWLYGGAVDLDLPGFTFLKMNLYVRDNPDFNGKTYQTTIAWKYPFEIGGAKFVSEGFADIAGDEDNNYNQNEHIVPRLLIDTGGLMGIRSGRFFTGIEYEYWHNKLGNKGVTESNPQLQFKWVF